MGLYGLHRYNGLMTSSNCDCFAYMKELKQEMNFAAWTFVHPQAHRLVENLKEMTDQTNHKLINYFYDIVQC